MDHTAIDMSAPCVDAVKSESVSHSVQLFETHGLYRPWDSPGQNTGVGSLALLQGIFPAQNQVNSLPPERPENPVIDAVAWLSEDQHPAEPSGSLTSPRLIIL